MGIEWGHIFTWGGSVQKGATVLQGDAPFLKGGPGSVGGPQVLGGTIGSCWELYIHMGRGNILCRGGPKHYMGATYS